MKTTLIARLIAGVLLAALALGPTSAWADGRRFADPWFRWGIVNDPHREHRPVVVAPHAPRFVVPAPGPSRVWVPGNWGWNGWSWVWVPGYWSW